MSEEEIIRNVKRIIEYKVISNYINDNDSRAIQGLLDLYNKEKEENKRIKSLDYTALTEEMEMGLWMPRADVEEYYVPIENLNDYIQKSKVREKIEKLKVLAEKADDETLNACELDIRKNQIYLLQSILKEGDK